jgi:hypothetical protein
MSRPYLVSFVLLWLLVVGESALLFLLLRELGRIYLGSSASLERDGVPIGEELPAVPVTTADGTEALPALVADDAYTLLLFVHPDCPHCPEAVRSVEAVTSREPELQAVVVSHDNGRAAYSELSNLVVVEADSDALSTDLGVRATPFAFVLDGSRKVVRKGVVNREADVRFLTASLPRTDGGAAAMADAVSRS